MYDLKWFKLDCRVFDNYKLKYCLMADNGLYYQLVWIKLLCEAAKRNDGGKIYVKRGSFIDLDQLAHLLDMDKQIVGEAICVFEYLDMIKYDNGEELVVKGFTEYQRGESADSLYDEEEQESRSADYAPEKLREEIVRERNREAQRKWRQRQREKRSAEKNGSNKEKKPEDNSVKQNNTKHNTESNENRNESVILRNAESNITDNESNNYGNGSSPKNIFIEENREEENRTDKSRGEENREEKINNNSLSPSQRVEEKKKYGTFENVYLSDTELEELRAKLGAGVLARLIDDLSEHIASTGKTYASHHATLLRWSKNEYAPREEGDRYAKASSRRGEEGAKSSSDGWDFANRKGPRDTPREPKNRYGDFDPEEAMRLAIERTMRECGR